MIRQRYIDGIRKVNFVKQISSSTVLIMIYLPL